MGFFMPMDCTVGYSTQHWLLVGIAGLTLVVLASLAELVVQWRRSGDSWRGWLPLAPTLLWSLVCGVLAGQAIGWYRDEAAYLSGSLQHVGGPPNDPIGLCFSIAQTGVEIQFALVVSSVLLIVGAAALLTRRRAPAA